MRVDNARIEQEQSTLQWCIALNRNNLTETAVTDPNQVLTTADAAKMLSCTIRKLQNDRNKRQGMPFIRLGHNRVGYLYKDIVEFIEERRIDHRAAA